MCAADHTRNKTMAHDLGQDFLNRETSSFHFITIVIKCAWLTTCMLDLHVRVHVCVMTQVMTSCQGLYAHISCLSVRAGSKWPTQATNTSVTFYFRSLTSHNIWQLYNREGYLYTHYMCSPASVQYAYNDIRLHNTKLHNTTHNGEYTTVCAHTT